MRDNVTTWVKRRFPPRLRDKRLTPRQPSGVITDPKEIEALFSQKEEVSSGPTPYEIKKMFKRAKRYSGPTPYEIRKALGIKER